MKARIARLNASYIDGKLTYDQYRAEARKLLTPIDWQRRIKYENTLFASIGN